MKDRINKVISHEGLTPSKFADILGVQRSSISHILSGRNNPGLDFLNKVLTHFPHISGDWLITGQGNMLKKASNPFKMPSLFDKSQSTSSSDLKSTEAIPLVNPDDVSHAGAMKANADREVIPELASSILSGSKNIERIIIFYNDRSFREYQPD